MQGALCRQKRGTWRVCPSAGLKGGARSPSEVNLLCSGSPSVSVQVRQVKAAHICHPHINQLGNNLRTHFLKNQSINSMDQHCLQEVDSCIRLRVESTRMPVGTILAPILTSSAHLSMVGSIPAPRTLEHRCSLFTTTEDL